MRDELESLVEDRELAHLFPRRGQPAERPWRLAVITMFQFVEDLSDRQAADAVRARIDWKYALGLDLDNPGFDHTVLSEFRTRLIDSDAERLLFDLMLERFRKLGLLKADGRQRTDSSHVLASVRALNRLELVRETFRHVLDVLATAVPAWMLAHARAEWVERYQGRTDEVRLPKTKEAQLEFADTIGADGHRLLEATYRADAPHWLREVPAVDILRRVWVQNYLPTGAGVRWRTTEDGLPKASQFVSSPFDTDAHLGRNHTTGWVSYKVHLTETCEDDAPNLITHVETTAAPTADGEMTRRIHRALQEQRLSPQVHGADSLAEEGLVAALTKQSAAMQARHDLKIRAKLSQEPPVPLASKEALYRIAQEALHNVVKHAQAHTAELTLEMDQTTVVLTVRDFGRGFERAGSFPGHFGLCSMHERAKAVGGMLSVDSTPQAGTIIRVSLPVDEAWVGRSSTQPRRPIRSTATNASESDMQTQSQKGEASTSSGREAIAAKQAIGRQMARRRAKSTAPTSRSRPAATCVRVHGGAGRRKLAVISQLMMRNSKEMVANAPASTATIGKTSITDRKVPRSRRRSGRLVLCQATLDLDSSRRMRLV